MKAIMLMLIFVGAFAQADSLQLVTNTLVGVNEAGDEIARVDFQADGKILLTVAGKKPELIEAKKLGTGEGEHGGHSYDLGKGRELEYSPGISGVGHYKDRVAHFMLWLETTKFIEMRADVSIQEHTNR
ncbi:MAG: hypothetical protein AB7G93_10720 [Bdellovibrionales bacterium]